MEILFLLVPISIALVGVAIYGFIWAVNHAQFEDLDRNATEALVDEVEDTRS